VRRTTAKAFAKNVFVNQERKSEVRRRSDSFIFSDGTRLTSRTEHTNVQYRQTHRTCWSPAVPSASPWRPPVMGFGRSLFVYVQRPCARPPHAAGVRLERRPASMTNEPSKRSSAKLRNKPETLELSVARSPVVSHVLRSSTLNVSAPDHPMPRAKDSSASPRA